MGLRYKVLLSVILLMFVLSGCSREQPSSDSAVPETERVDGPIRGSDILVDDISGTAEKTEIRKNPYPDLDIPTQITKIGDQYFIVDCYHNEIIYNDNLNDPLDQWYVLTDEINKGHTLAGDGTVYLTDDTENDRIMVFEKSGDRFVFSQKFDNITSRPHYIVYDKDRKSFFAWCSMSGEMYVFRHGENDSRMYLTDVRSIPELNGVYVRSFTIIGDDIYFVSGNSSIIKADLDSFKILERYPVPSSMAGMIQLTKIEDYFYITISTDDKWDQNYATIIRCNSLEGLKDNKYEDIYRYFIGGGTPYYISEIDGEYYLTEHRIPGHSIWRFHLEGYGIKAETIYPKDNSDTSTEEEPVSEEVPVSGEISAPDGFYQKLKKGEDVSVLINGDSIAAGAGASEGKSWDSLLKDFISSEYGSNCTMTNISMGGNGSYAGFIREGLLNDDISYDLVIICYGQNDGRKKIASDYEAIIRTTLEKYPDAEIISILESSQKEYTKKINTIKELDTYYDIPSADMIAAFNESGVPYEELTVDEKHPNDAGHGIYFDVLSGLIKEKTASDFSGSGELKAPRNENVRDYKKLKFFPAESFKIEDDLTRTLSIEEGIIGEPGIYQTFGPGDGKIILSSDKGSEVESELAWPYDFKQDFITPLDDGNFEASDSLRITFSSPEWAEGFKGLLLCGR